jgi:hypothetical protein
MKFLSLILISVVFLTNGFCEVQITEAQVLKVFVDKFNGNWNAPSYKYIERLLIKVNAYHCDFPDLEDNVDLIQKIEEDRGLLEVHLHNYPLDNTKEYYSFLRKHKRVFSDKVKGGLMISGALYFEPAQHAHSKIPVPVLKSPNYKSSYGVFNPNKPSAASSSRTARFNMTYQPFTEKIHELVMVEFADDSSALDKLRCDEPKNNQISCEVVIRDANPREYEDDVNRYKYLVRIKLVDGLPDYIEESKEVALDEEVIAGELDKDKLKARVLAEIGDNTAVLLHFSCFDKNEEISVCHATFREKTMDETEAQIEEAMRTKFEIQIRTQVGQPLEILSLNEISPVNQNTYNEELHKLFAPIVGDDHSELVAVECDDLSWTRVKCLVTTRDAKRPPLQALDQKINTYQHELLILRQFGYPQRVLDHKRIK